MKYRTIIIVLILSLAAFLGFSQNTDWRGGRGCYGYYNTENAENLSISGAISFEDNHHPVIEKDGVEYELMVPYRYLYDTGVKEGDQVKIEGYKIDGDFCTHDDEEEENEVHLFVTKAEINGKVYDFTQNQSRGRGFRGNPGMMRGGMMNRGWR